jgi:YegS/Rv2252/BmrU family lipid kinase
VSVVLIINPIAGRARPGKARTRFRLATSIAASLSTPIDIVVTERAGHARELAKAAVDRGARLVIAWGGDGTINEVASVLAFGDVALGIVPAGSGNGLARELGISPKPDRAIAAALAARPRAIDLGEVEGRLFVNLAGIGFAAHVASAFAQSHRRGFLGYVGITARALRSYVPLEYAISVGGPVVRVRALLVTLANSQQFGNGARIAPGARVDDGLLDLVTIEERSRLATIWSLPRLFTGTIDRLRGCRIDRVREVSIEADRPLTFHVDGEPVDGGTTVHARVHPGALKIAV